MPVNQLPSRVDEEGHHVSAQATQSDHIHENRYTTGGLYSPITGDDIFYTRKHVAVLGAHYTGKSSLAKFCVNKTFNHVYTPTFAEEFLWRTQIKDVHYEVTIVDTQGQDGRLLLGPHFTIGIDAYVLVFSCCDPGSFEAVKSINKNLLRVLGVSEARARLEIPRILVGNKVDKRGSCLVPYSAAYEFAACQGISIVQTCVPAAYNVEKVFVKAVSASVANWHRSLTIQDNGPESHFLSNDGAATEHHRSNERSSLYNLNARPSSELAKAILLASLRAEAAEDEDASLLIPETALQMHEVPALLDSVFPVGPGVGPPPKSKSQIASSSPTDCQHKSKKTFKSCIMQ